MRRSLLSHLRRNPLSLTAVCALALLAGSAILGPALYPYQATAIDLEGIKLPPTLDHPCGTDSKGRDVLSRIIYGGRISLGISVCAAVLSLAIGLLLGLMAGYFGGKLDNAVTMLIDITMAFPSLLLAIGITVVLPPGLYTVVIALALVGWATFARLVRGLTISQRASLYVEASRSIGCATGRILVRHILPNCISTVLVALSLKMGSFILAEAALSFLGLGVQPPVPTWGSMVGLDRIYIHSAPWMVIFPGLAIAISTFAFNLLGDSLRDYLDPHLRM